MGWRKAKIVDGKVALTEAQWKTQVIEFARAHGWLVSEMIDGEHNKRQQGDAGAPDLLLTHERSKLALHVELKTDDGRLKPMQRRWIESLEEAGHDCEIWRPRDWDVIKNLLTN